MNDKPLLMLTLPNSGSTWLASLIAQHTKWNRYFQEFFNPIRNAPYFQTLSKEFGCELVSCYRNIASRGSEGIHNDIETTWGVEPFNFTKEIFSPAKLPVFIKHFKVFVLLRDEDDSFPPRRLRVWSFYEHAWQAYADTGITRDGGEFRLKALEAYRLMKAVMLSDANQYNVPVINYRDLFDDAGLQEKLQLAIGDNSGQLLQAIQDSRVRITR